MTRLVTVLREQKGVAEAHIHEQQLCLHYDPNLISVERLRRLGREAGAEILKRYDHRLLAITDLPQDTNVSHIESALKKLPGVTYTAVSYPAQTMTVEFDSATSLSVSEHGDPRCLCTEYRATRHAIPQPVVSARTPSSPPP